MAAFGNTIGGNIWGDWTTGTATTTKTNNYLWLYDNSSTSAPKRERKAREETALEWLDRRVDEMRVALP